MSKEKPTPENKLFNHEEENLCKAAGINSRQKIHDRICKVEEAYTELYRKNGQVSRSELAEMVLHSFTHKELAVMWTTEVTEDSEDPVAEILRDFHESLRNRE